MKPLRSALAVVFLGVFAFGCAESSSKLQEGNIEGNQGTNFCQKSDSLKKAIIELALGNVCDDVSDQFISNLTSLKNLSVAEGVLKSDDFVGFNNLQELQIKNINTGTLLAPTLFQPLTNLSNLDLQFSRVSRLSAFDIGILTNLKTLSLGSIKDPVEAIGPSTFTSLNQVQDFQIYMFKNFQNTKALESLISFNNSSAAQPFQMNVHCQTTTLTDQMSRDLVYYRCGK